MDELEMVIQPYVKVKSIQRFGRTLVMRLTVKIGGVKFEGFGAAWCAPEDVWNTAVGVSYAYPRALKDLAMNVYDGTDVTYQKANNKETVDNILMEYARSIAGPYIFRN